MENFLKTLFPEECLFCHREGTSFCSYCLETCELLTYGVCLVCQNKSFGGNIHSFCRVNGSPSSVFSPFLYKDKVRECIVRSKYATHEFGALKNLAFAGCLYYIKTDPRLDDFVVTSVPISWSRYKQRGFNQVDVIAKVLAKLLGLKLETTVLTRNKDTKAQSGQSRIQRRENVREAFSINKFKTVSGKKFLLVDDICTTGSTLMECSKVLYAAGALEVRCFTVARVL